jgi:hypothetical protein
VVVERGFREYGDGLSGDQLGHRTAWQQDSADLLIGRAAGGTVGGTMGPLTTPSTIKLAQQVITTSTVQLNKT